MEPKKMTNIIRLNKKRGRIFTEFYKLLSASGKDKTKQNICQRVLIDDKNLVATNGYYLFILDKEKTEALTGYGFEDIENGTYEILKYTKSDILLMKDNDAKCFPDYNCIISDNPKFIRNSEIKENREGIESTFLYFLSYVMINPFYLKLIADGLTYQVKKHGDHVLEFMNDNFRGVFMGIDTDDEII